MWSSVWININRVTLQHNKEFIMFIFFFLQGFYRCVIFKSVWYARHFEYSCKQCSLNDWKQTAQRLKWQKRLLTINKRTIIRWNIYRQQFLFTKTSIKVSLKTWVFKPKAYNKFMSFKTEQTPSKKPASWSLLVFKDELEARKSFKTFFLQPEL